MRDNAPPEPQAIDPASGFKVPLRELQKQWDGELVAKRFIDKRRHPQDFVRGVTDKQALPYSRPESPDRFMAENILWEDYRPMLEEAGAAMLEEGEVTEL
jgi:hypothetical protein